MSAWREIGDRIFVRRYPFLDQNIGAIVGDDGVLIVDTRASHRQADELRRDLRAITSLPVTEVVNTHMHWDHVFGNARFRPAPIRGHERCAAALRANGEAQRAALPDRYPELVDEFAEVEIVPPDRTFDERATVTWGGRSVELRHLGRGHTDNDIVVVVPGPRPDAPEVVFAGDLLENGAPPWFGDSFPLDWPATAEAIVALMGTLVVPGHGDLGDRGFAAGQAAELRAIAELARRVDRGELALAEAVRLGPYPPGTMTDALGRALVQLRGEPG